MRSLPLHAQELDKKLSALKRMVRGKKTPLDKVDKISADLLAVYSEPKDLGQIYFTLCHVYAQSGQMRPDKTAKFAEKALHYPLETEQRLMLYTYWGDAIMIAGQKQDIPLPERRKEAAKLYVQGLKEADELDLPKSIPPPPKADNIQPTDPEFGKLFIKHQQAMEEYRQKYPKALEKLVFHRKVLKGQLVYLYSRKPFDTKEADSMARAVLHPESAEELLEEINAAVTKLGGEPHVRDASANYVLLAVAAVTFLIAALFLVPYVYEKLKKPVAKTK